MSTGTPSVTLDSLLEFIKEARGFDFTGYKRASIERRVQKRMSEVHAETYDDYVDFLELHAAEFVALFNTVLINVTAFFRDEPTWEYLAAEVLPQLISARPPDAPIRVWCAGCASGEEAYTVAMVFARVLGDNAFRDRVKIYATDIDEEALDQARQGAYVPRQIENIPADALERFFERTEQRYVFRRDLRRNIIFGRNDLVQDAPISRIDMLVCRNTLMYFTAETQAQVLRRFHFAVDARGVLLLGKSEMLITHSKLFTPVDLKWRAFRKVARPSLQDKVRVKAVDSGNGASLSVGDNLRDAAFAMVAGAHVVLDSGGALVMANGFARRTFGLGLNDFGRLIKDLELSYRPLELRGHLDRLSQDLRPIDIPAVSWRGDDQDRIFDVRLVPLMSDGSLLGTCITYADVTDAHGLQEQLAASRQELEHAYEELQSAVEELETTNEELQSTNEELETTNEELQSTNEELETMNEELQSSNEELETMNDELQHRTLELDDINAFLETILTTIGLAVAVLDAGQHVQIWNSEARELWGMTAEEAEGQHVLTLDIGLPLEQLRPGIRAILTDHSTREELTVPATNRRGKGFSCRVRLLPLSSYAGAPVSGVIMMMEPAAPG